MDTNYNELFQDTLDFYNSKILVAYQGVFERQLLGAMAKNLESSIQDAALSKRLFRIFIEIAQNIAFYSAEKSQFENRASGNGILIMKGDSNLITISGGNLVENNNIGDIQNHCEQINKQDHDGLREMKRIELEQRLNNGKPGHLGFIQMALLSGNKIRIDIKKVDETYSFIIISSYIDI